MPSQPARPTPRSEPGDSYYGYSRQRASNPAAGAPMHPEQRLRLLRAVVFAGPLIAVSSWLLYKRFVLGEEPKRLPDPNNLPGRTSVFQEAKKASRQQSGSQP